MTENEPPNMAAMENDEERGRAIIEWARKNRRPAIRLQFPAPVAEILQWVPHYDREAVGVALRVLTIDTVDGVYVEPNSEAGSTFWIACDLGLIWIRHHIPAPDRRLLQPEIETDITPWDSVKDPEMTVTITHAYTRFPSWDTHLKVQLPRIDLKDSASLRAPDLLGSLGRAILRRKQT